MIKKNVVKIPLQQLGYGFIDSSFIPENNDEYYLRNIQERSGRQYRKLTAFEIEQLVHNRNTSDNWDNVLVSGVFNPQLISNCKFYGLVRIGKLENYCLSYSNLQLPVGLYHSTIISCDIGDNVVIRHVNYLSHYIIGDEVMLVNIQEMQTTQVAKFGNGIVKEGEQESNRIWLEICNENGGRKVIPFNGMLTADAYLWSKYRDDKELLNKFIDFTEKKFNKKRGYYGKVGSGTVIKNCGIIKDVWIGEWAYIKGANKLKNLTINSMPDATTQIGEGVELVNGIVEEGCRIFYGVKAVRFFMASHSQLKYGARLINSYLGNNATISCCEVLNSLIYPAHEQHHNNSFLCASLIMGQSNVAAGATLGSNHNSRSADGEFTAKRGFWPGLCVSIKHNSYFASFTILAKGDYPSELNIQLPFSLINNDVANNKLVIMPAYWFMYNLYALERNAWKYVQRDKRIEKKLYIEYDYLAPDTIEEIKQAIQILAEAVGKAYHKLHDNLLQSSDYETGLALLHEKHSDIAKLEVLLNNAENSKRKVEVIKVQEAYDAYVLQLEYYGLIHLYKYVSQNIATDVYQVDSSWLNIGGQLIKTKQVEQLKSDIRNNVIQTWDAVHEFYEKQSVNYELDKTMHALQCLLHVYQVEHLNQLNFATCFKRLVTIEEQMLQQIKSTREKDYTNFYRAMTFDSKEEQEAVFGKQDENSFIIEKEQKLKQLKHNISLFEKV